MITKQLSSELSHTELPEVWRSEVLAQLSSGENVSSALEVDLDARLHFAKGLILVTERRIMARAPGETVWQSWPYEQDLTLKLHDHAGVGHLELFNKQGRLANWRFTLGQNLLAIRLAEKFAALRESRVSGAPMVQDEEHICPSCKAPLEPDQDECPICTKAVSYTHLTLPTKA